MNAISKFIVKHKNAVVALFISFAVICMLLQRLVDVNYDLKTYLPEDTNSTMATQIMSEEFEASNSNARVLIKDAEIAEVLSIKKQIASIQGVKEIRWMDDAVDVYQPLEMIPQKTLDSWYKENSAIFSLTIDEDYAVAACEEIEELIGERGELTGDIVDTVRIKSSTGGEVGAMLGGIVIVILIILFLTTGSFFEPILFMFTMFIAILLNSGTNIFLGEISFITKTTATILQLAVSMDYSIFLLHRFSEFRREGEDVKEAMIHAMQKSYSSIVASGITTVIGFGALGVMRFKIGPDLGTVLAKGVIFSILAVLVLLPALTVCTYRLIDKTRHRDFFPPSRKLALIALKLGTPILIIVGVILAPAYLGQKSSDFMYGASVVEENDITETERLFGKSNDMVLLVPVGDRVKEKELSQALIEKEYVSSVISYANSVGVTIPSEYLSTNVLSSLESENYSRIILKLNLEQESNETFDAISEIRNMAESAYGNDCYLVGVSASIYDMRNTVVQDNKMVSMISILGIGIVLLFIFRSIAIPLILLFTIETSIWINLAIPYFSGNPLVFIVYMIISAIQLGSTVDYAILYTGRYRENRNLYDKKEAAIKTIMDTSISILTSASILTAAGFIIGTVSSNGVTGQLGTLIGRGTVLSATMVLFFLPTMLLLCDPLVHKKAVERRK